MRALAEARPAELDPEAPVDARTRSAELAGAMSTAHSRTLPARRRVRPLWGGGLGLAGVAAAATLVITTTGGGPGPVQSSRGPTDIRTVLLSAAAKAETAPATGKYWRVSLLQRLPRKVGPKSRPYTVETTRVIEDWTSRGGAAWLGMRDAGAKPKTRRDEQAWLLDGSPARWDLGAGDSPSGAHLYLRSEPDPGTLTKKTGRTELRVPIAGPEPSFDDLERLPSDPAALRRLADERARNDGDDEPLQADTEQLRQSFVARKLIDLLTTAPVPPKVRAGAFRALADLPIVRSEGGAVDDRGRKGVALTTVTRYAGASTGVRLIIDPASSQVLSEQEISRLAAGKAPSKQRTTLYLGAGWTDEAPRVPAIP
jgi:hypothetical protein